MTARLLEPSQEHLPSSTRSSSIDLLTVSTGERRVLVQGGTFPRYLPSGHLVFIRAGSLMAIPFDLKTLETRGVPVEVLRVEDAETALGLRTGART